MSEKVLLVGPLNAAGAGGRLEEMKVWASLITNQGRSVTVFTPYFAKSHFEASSCLESADVVLKGLLPRSGWIRSLFLRVWYSKLFKSARDRFYATKSWEDFASGFSTIILFITEKSREVEIFKSNLSTVVFTRFTGLIGDLHALKQMDQTNSSSVRGYIFHSKELIPDIQLSKATRFVDQTAAQEDDLLQLNLVKQAKTFAMIGLFMPIKQMEEVIRLFAQLKNLKLKIYGKGESEPAYRNLIQATDASNVEICGFVEPKEISRLYSEFDVLIINSISETGPMTGVEAMAAGRIILTKKVGSMPSRLGGESQLLYDSIDELKAKILSLEASTAQEIHEISTFLRDRYLQNYSNKSLSSQIENILN
ncbi:glycosyltransferase family 4 protein [Algoriphagus namhaensis]